MKLGNANYQQQNLFTTVKREQSTTSSTFQQVKAD
jgi:hypothetical protein